jgi:hypothetical protein
MIMQENGDHRAVIPILHVVLRNLGVATAMRWDDLQLLRIIDAIEQGQGGMLSNGLHLMQDPRWGGPIDRIRDLAPFVRELLLARKAGYVEFNEQVWAGQGPVDPAVDPNLWVQRIQDIHLTLAGRDRARGRVVSCPPTDPAEDDDRPIAAITLEDIARSVGAIYNAAQIPKFLRASGVPDEFIPAVS